MEKKHTPPTPPKDEAIFPIVVNSKPNMNKALKLAQHIMSKLKTSDEEAEYKEPVKHTQLRFKIIDNTKLLYIGFISDNKGNSFCKILRDEVESKEEATERAEFIVQACNNYERLQSENERMREFLEKRKKKLEYMQRANYFSVNDGYELAEIQTLLNPK